MSTSNNSRLDEIRASANLPSPRGVALRVIQLTHKDDVTNQEIALAIKPDPALSSRIIKVANARVAYQTQPVMSVIDAVSVLGLNTVRQLVLGLSLMDSSRNVACQKFDYQSFWAHSLLTAITAQNLVLLTGAGSSENAFLLGLLGQVGALALAAVCPQEYGRILGTVAPQMDPELANLERAEFGFDHNQLTQAMLADWGMPQLFQEVALHHENPGQASFTHGSRDWCLLNMLHIADYCSRTCLAQGPQRRKMIPKLILIASHLGVELDALARLGDKSACEWHEWSKLCGMRSAEVPPFAELLAAAPLTPDLLEIGETLPGDAGVLYKLRILLVDDEQDALLVLKTLLEKAGHTVVAARNKVEALDLLEEYKPQLIIADWGMLEMGGIELCRALRQNPLWRDTYVLILAAQESTDRLVEAFEAGANDYITRPVNFKELGARLHAAQRVVQLQEDIELDRQQLHKITDELAAFNQRLRKSDVNMRAILDNSPYMAWLKDAEGRYIKVNKAYADYVRLKNVQQVIGKTDFDLWPKAMAEKYRADDDEIMALRQKKHIEESSLDGDRVHWVETYKTPVIDENGNVLGTTGFARDITERKQAEEALRRSEAKLHTLYNSTSDAVMLLDEKGFFDCNMATLAMFGCATKEEFCSKHPADLSPPKQPCGTDSMTLANRQIATALKNGSNFFEWLHKRADTGNIFPADVLLNSMELDGKKALQATVRDTTERKLAVAEIESLAFYDPLTRLPNRRLLLDRLKQAFASSARSGMEGALLFLDLDNFKALNDTLGHDTGDQLLQQVAERLQSCVREGDTVARLGGDEFVVMLENLSKQALEAAAQAETVGKKILDALSHSYQLDTHEYNCTTSIGVALFNDHKQNKDDLLKQADIAMYQAKKNGRNTLSFFDPQMQEIITARVTLESGLRRAVAEQEEFQLYYQIQVDSSGRPVGAESLLRWLHPERGMVSPAQFIPLAEETGLILPLGHWVMATACRQLAAWEMQPETSHFTLAVNVSAKQFNLPNFVDEVLALVDYFKIDPTKLKLEITESLMVANVDDIIAKMTMLKTRGISFSMDDFGTGYSSLSYLKRLPLDQLKIDQSFVRNITVDDNDRTIVRTIIAMAHSLNLSVIAEGVETEEQRQRLLNKGCTAYQGYLFGRPVPIEQFEEILFGAVARHTKPPPDVAL